MAIAENATIDFFGTQDEVTTSSASVADTVYSILTDTSVWTNDDDAPMASVTAKLTFGTGPTAGTTVDLFIQKNNVEGTDDDDFPADDRPFTYVGSFPLDNVTSEQIQTIDIVLPNYKTSSEYVFVVKNNGGQTLSAAWQLFVTPKT